MDPALVKRLAEYPSFIYAKEYAELDAPEVLVERARRLYVLSPLLDPDWNWTPFRFARDDGWATSFYMLDMRQGEAVTLAVCPDGFVLEGIDSEASVRLWQEPEEIRDGLRRLDEGVRQLLSVLEHPMCDQGGRPFCIWRGLDDGEWRAAPGMTETAEAGNDSLGMVWFLAAPPRGIGAFAADFADNPRVGRAVEAYLSADAPRTEDLLKVPGLGDSVADLIKERGWVVGLRAG